MSHKRSLIYPAIILPILALTACGSSETVDSSKVASDEVFITYHLTYDETTEAAAAFAQFRVGGSTGTTLRLNRPASVDVDGRSMTLRDGDSGDEMNFIGTYYELNGLKAKRDYEFSYTDKNDKTHEHAIAFPEPAALLFPTTREEIKLDRGLTTVIEGADLEEGEHFQVTLTAKVPGKDSSTAFKSAIAHIDHEVQFSAEDLEEFAGASEIEVIVKRERRERLSEENGLRGVSIMTRYESAPVTLKVAGDSLVSR